MSGHRRKKGHAEEHHVDERWLVSYADMITVLMALFIVLYALSAVNQKKFDELKNSLASGFGVTKSEKVDSNTGVVPKQFVKVHGAGFSATTLSAAQEAKEVKKYLAQAGASAQVKAGATSVTISLVGSSAYFGGNDAALGPESIAVLKAIKPVLKAHEGKITIEGHASPLGSAGVYGTDNALSAIRASNVLDALVNEHAVQQSDISGAFYGSAGATSGTSAAVQQKNRRVDIVLHQPPAAAAATETTTTGTAEKSGTAEKTTTEKTGTAEKSTTEKSGTADKTTTEKTSEHATAEKASTHETTTKTEAEPAAHH